MVEFAIHNFESVKVCCIAEAVVVVDDELLNPPIDDIAVVAVLCACPKAIAIGLGEESGDDVSDDTLNN